MADGESRRLTPYRETFWIMAFAVLTPIGLAAILLITFYSLTIKGALLAGDVAAAHAQIEIKCESCHDPFKGPTDAKCQQCHAETLVREHAPGWNLPVDHGGLKMQDCKHCHVDHHGRHADLKAQASIDCVMCHGFHSVGDSSRLGMPHPEVRMIKEDLYKQPQNGFRQFTHAHHLGQYGFDKDGAPASGETVVKHLQCTDCHTFDSSRRVLLSTDVKFDRDCKVCHSDQLTWLPSRHAQPVTVTHPNKPVLADNADAGTTAHDAFLAWSSDQKCGQCHLLLEHPDASNPKTESFEVAPTRIESESTWVKTQHWGYSEFSHQRHLNITNNPLHCTQCHQSSDQYETIDSPTFEKHCTQCHADDTSLYMGRNVPKIQVKHPQVPAWASTVDAATQLSQMEQWAGIDPTTKLPLGPDREDQRKCAKCHVVQEHQGTVSMVPLGGGGGSARLEQRIYGAHPAGLDPLLAQATPDASATPAAADTASASAAASPAAAEPASPAAATPAPAATDTTAASPAPSPSPTPMNYNKLDAPLALPEDHFVQMGTGYQVRIITAVGPSHSLVTHFDHKPHITLGMEGRSQVGDKQCLACHTVLTTPKDQPLSGAGLFDMELLPGIANCAKCHNNEANGVGNKCGLCHDFHDKTRHDAASQLAPQSSRPDAGRSLASQLQSTWAAGR